MTRQRPIAWRRLAPEAPGGGPLADIDAYLSRPETLAALDEAESGGGYPRGVLADLRALSLAELFVPDRANSPELGALNAITARRSGSLAITLGVNALALLPVYLAGTDEQCLRVADRLRAGAAAALLLTELEHGSNLLGNEAAARPDGACFVLSGEKHLINGGTEHELLVALMRTGARGPSGPRVAALRDFTLFLVERDSTVAALPRWRTLPARAADISGVRFAGTRVPAEAVIGAVGDGFAVVQKTLMVSHGGIAALASGAVSGALEVALGYAHTREMYGAPIVSMDAIAEHLVRMVVLDTVVAAMAVKAAYASSAFGPGGGYLGAAAKYACCRLAEEAVGEGRHVLGARALLESLPYARFVRDVLLYGVFDGTSHVMLDDLSGHALRFAAAAKTRSGPDPARDMYVAVPRPIRVARKPWRPYAPALAPRCRELAAASGDGAVSALADLAAALESVVRDARAAGRWTADQAFRFESAAVLAELEALLAVCELAAPACRATLGLPGPASADAAAAAVAVDWLGGRLAHRIGDLARSVGSAAAEDAVAAEKGRADGAAEQRAVLRAFVATPPPVPEGRQSLI